MKRVLMTLLAAAPLLAASRGLADEPSVAEAERAMRKAAEFFREKVAAGGGYVWRYSSDLAHRQGEGAAGPKTIWVQPPGTPAVGEAFLDAFDASGDRYYLDAAREAGEALVKGQLQSGGWYYRVELDPAKRGEFRYRVDPQSSRKKAAKDDPIGGWDVWKKHENKDNVTMVDDDTTPAAVRFLTRLDRALGFRVEPIHEAAAYALGSLLNAQHPIGAWSHNYDRFGSKPPDPGHYPPRDASYPESWSRTWTKDWTGCYSINDRISLNAIRTMLLAWEVYGDGRYRASAERGGAFLIRAQLPDPQPAWAQQYDREMHPVWERKFEPPAITGFESQDALETLLLLYRKTGDRKYLAPIPRALAYLKASRLPDGRLARFYELKTNRPLYFTRDYVLTHDNRDVPTHYGFAFDSRLDAIEAEYLRLKDKAPGAPLDEARPAPAPDRAGRVLAILKAQDPRGAWTEPGSTRDVENRKVTPEDGIIQSATFIQNLRTLAEFVADARGPK
jgi:hypothetical protein